MDYASNDIDMRNYKNIYDHLNSEGSTNDAVFI